MRRALIIDDLYKPWERRPACSADPCRDPSCPTHADPLYLAQMRAMALLDDPLAEEDAWFDD